MTAPWIARQLKALLHQRGHAWLLQGPSGLGQYDVALGLARAWLCESPTEQGACGHCASCHAIDVRSSADLRALMPETVMLELGWPLSEDAQKEIDDKKRKASKLIRVEAVRDAVAFTQITSARGGSKVVLIYPAERMNMESANTLLKTLEEPPGDVKFILATEAAHQLLPTLRSRCQTHVLAWPAQDEALQWLAAQDVLPEAAAVWLHAAGGRPDDALQLAKALGEPKHWRTIPKAMQRGEVAPVAEWSPAALIDAQLKLCHDLMALNVGAAPRYFDAADLPAKALPLSALKDWQQELAQEARSAEHPFNQGLMLESLVSRAQKALSL